MIPFILFTMKGKGWKDSLLLFVVLQVALNGMTYKIVSEPIPGFFAFLFGVPAACSLWVQLIIWNQIRKRIRYGWWIPLFVSISMIADWQSFEHSSFGMWGTAAASQVNNIELLQIVSIGGISLITALMAAVSILGALLIYDTDKKRWKGSTVTIATALSISLIYGSFRIYTQQDTNTVRTAAITTNLHLDASGVFPEPALCIEEFDSLFSRTVTASTAGAEVVVWNEGASLAYPDFEEAIIEKGKRIAQEQGIDLIMAYIVLLSEDPFLYDNKYVWITSDGEVIENYRKHHPVPGEPCIKGTEELLVHTRPWGTGTGAICYDYDFPSMAREQGRKGAGLALVPSSDWFGIDPYHTRMNRIRAIEGGFSVIRPVRWATTEAYDAYGRIRASMPYNEGNRIMIVDLPTTPVSTLYSKVGDWPVWIAFLVLLSTIISLIKNGIKKRR